MFIVVTAIQLVAVCSAHNVKSLVSLLMCFILYFLMLIVETAVLQVTVCSTQNVEIFNYNVTLVLVLVIVNFFPC